MSLVKHNNNSISAVTSMASLTTGSMTLIKEQTASSSASISFVDGSSDVVLDSTYPIYKFEFINIHPATDNTSFQFQCSTNTGSSYGVAVTTTYFRAQHNEGDSNTSLTYISTDDLAQSTNFVTISEDVGNDNDQAVSGTLQIFNPSSTTFVKHFLNNFSGAQRNDFSFNEFMAGYFNTTSAIDAVQFKFASGNMDSGTIKLYGIKDS